MSEAAATPDEEQVRTSLAQRTWHGLKGFFSETVRQATPQELACKTEIVGLKEEVKILQWELEKARTENSLQRLQIDGMTRVLTWHEQLWQTQIALESRRQAQATEQP